MKKVIIFGACAALLPMFAFAAYLGAGDNVTTPAPAAGVAQNAYLAGGTVNVLNPVAGDLMAAGGTVVVSSKVDRDIMVVGGNVSLSGASAEDIRIGGGNIAIGAKVAGEMMVAGGQIVVASDSKITKDSYIAGGTVSFSGTESGNLTLVGGRIRIDGVINGNLVITRAEEVTFGSQAVIKGTTEYSSPKEAVVESGAKIAGTPVFHQIQDIRENFRPRLFATFFGVMFFLKLIAMLAAAYLLWYLRRNDMTVAIQGVYVRFWGSLLTGFGVLVLLPIAGVILFVTVVGWVPAAVMLAIYGALLVLASPVAAILASSILMATFRKSKTELKWYHILLGFVVLKIIAMIPFIGWLACFVIYLLALGSISKILKTKFAQ